MRERFVLFALPAIVARLIQHPVAAAGLPPLPSPSASLAERADAMMDWLVARLGGKDLDASAPG